VIMNVSPTFVSLTSSTCVLPAAAENPQRIW
jgi:hypothetical protein